MNRTSWTSASYHHSSQLFPCVLEYSFGEISETVEAAYHKVIKYELCLHHEGTYARNELEPFIFESIEHSLDFALLFARTQKEEFNINVILPWIIIGFHKDVNKEVWVVLNSEKGKVKKMVEFISLFFAKSIK